MSPATVGTSTTLHTVSYAYQRKSFHTEGLFWAFYCDGTNAGWKTSTDGIDWSGAFTSIGVCSRGDYFSVWFDGTHVHYTRYDNTDQNLYYRRGTPENDGSITWSAVEQTVDDGSYDDRYVYPCIAVDTNGYAWIGATYDHNGGTIEYPYVLKNANNDGTWALDFVYELSAVDDYSWRVCPVPLTLGKVYVIYCRTSAAPCGNLWNGAAWVGEENDLADFNIEDQYGFSAVALGDNVHFAYNRDVTYQIRHNERVWGVGWDVNDVLVQDAVTANTVPALSVVSFTGGVYCFWTSTVTDHVYYKQYTGGAWGGLVDWIDESTDDIQTDYLINSFYMDYGGYIGLLYTTLLASPYNVRFDFLTMPVGWTGKISGVTNPAEIAGVIATDIAEVKGVA